MSQRAKRQPPRCKDCDGVLVLHPSWGGIRLRCKSCGTIYLVGEYKGDLDVDTEAKLACYPADRVE